MRSPEGQLVEHGDSLSVCKQAQEELLGGFECEIKTSNTLSISGLLLNFITTRTLWLDCSDLLGEFAFDAGDG